MKKRGYLICLGLAFMILLPLASSVDEEKFASFKTAVEEIIVAPFSSFLNSLPETYQIIFNIVLYTLLILIYAVFVYEFYTFLSRKNLLELNLSKYNKFKTPYSNNFFSALLFILEYIIVLPILVFFWFFVLSFLILLLSKEQSVQQILLLAAAVIAAIRLTAYFKEELSKEIAKIFPLAVLVIFLLSPNFLNFASALEKLTYLPLLLSQTFIFLIFILLFEILIRLVYSIVLLFKKPKIEEEELQELQEESEIEKKPEEESIVNKGTGKPIPPPKIEEIKKIMKKPLVEEKKEEEAEEEEEEAEEEEQIPKNKLKRKRFAVEAGERKAEKSSIKKFTKELKRQASKQKK